MISDLIREAAKRLCMQVVEVTLCEVSPEDLIGIPELSTEREVAKEEAP